jgi:beta-aspartyl-peptidase (threonine type)
MAKLLRSIRSAHTPQNMNKIFAIALHGGAGTLSKENMTEDQRHAHEKALLHALEAGAAILQKGGTSLDAVEAAVNDLENCALFNAGKGSVFNREGKHDMDAAIMDGRDLRAGAVAGITGVKNPIQLARTVLNKGNHVFLSGEKAMQLAQEEGLAMESDEYFYTEMRYQEWLRTKAPAQSPKPENFGTVGAVALDMDGHLAAATSTGGLVNKQYGRIGDSCVIGSGTYANDRTCAVSCTGEGEIFIRGVAAYDISCLVEYRGIPLQAACEQVLEKLDRLGGKGGLIAIHRSGLIAMPFTSEGMYRACFHPNGTRETGIY